METVCERPHWKEADDPELIPDDEQELENALRVPSEKPAANQTEHSVVDQDLGAVHTADVAAVDRSFGHAAQPHCDLNYVTVEYTCVFYNFQTIAFKTIRTRSTSP